MLVIFPTQLVPDLRLEPFLDDQPRRQMEHRDAALAAGDLAGHQSNCGGKDCIENSAYSDPAAGC